MSSYSANPTYREITFKKPTYLTLDQYFSEIIINTNNVQYAGNDEAEDSEQAEIDLLTQALDNSQLAVRNTAYQLLKGIDSKRAKKSIDKGVKLKPGDKIYSVYQSGRSFTDQDYILYDWVDYLENIYPQVYEEYEVDEQEQAANSQRVFCFVDKEKAEQAAELLHQKLILETGFGLCGFEWCKENPDFNLKQWCSNNNIDFNPEWEKLFRGNNISCDYFIIWKVIEIIEQKQDEVLYDKFRRARYIYILDHIDTWCKENNVFFDDKIKYFHPEYWNKYREIIDYLYLPENIELLSKFWKDGVGHFAFVKEEFVQEATYLKFENNLLESVSSGNNYKLIAKPANYDEIVGDFLIKILHRTDIMAKFKAYKLLREINTQKAKQAVEQGIPLKLGDRIFHRQNNALQNDIEF
ncbi:conserved hypothetical protein [Hyella patelloides LEGE 07179]|uniref:Uncharacterized protein n=1 Tax=Hyella patelloides LEGE 07179 TaxID=945734 RepID=A0A563VXU1_9CYAN|nr:hypothetical protein [Hyella patelloides]VEP16262.1 conserved hypothetical protein [Hyella patelloides LEGE 07179]